MAGTYERRRAWDSRAALIKTAIFIVVRWSCGLLRMLLREANNIHVICVYFWLPNKFIIESGYGTIPF